MSDQTYPHFTSRRGFTAHPMHATSVYTGPAVYQASVLVGELNEDRDFFSYLFFTALDRIDFTELEENFPHLF